MKNQIEQRVDLFSKVIGWIRNIRKQIQIALQVLTKETCVSLQKVFHQCVLPVHRLKIVFASSRSFLPIRLSYEIHFFGCGSCSPPYHALYGMEESMNRNTMQMMIFFFFNFCSFNSYFSIIFHRKIICMWI